MHSFLTIPRIARNRSQPSAGYLFTKASLQYLLDQLTLVTAPLDNNLLVNIRKQVRGVFTERIKISFGFLKYLKITFLLQLETYGVVKTIFFSEIH